MVEQVYGRKRKSQILWLGGVTFGLKEAFLSKKWGAKV